MVHTASAKRQAKAGVSIGFLTQSLPVTYAARGCSCQSCELQPALASAQTQLGLDGQHPSVRPGRAGLSTLPGEPSLVADPAPGPRGAASLSGSQQIPSFSSSLHDLLFPMWKPNATSLGLVRGLQTGTISPPQAPPRALHMPEGLAKAELC